MGFPIPKSTGDKILSVLGAVVTVCGIAASFASGQGLTGIASSIGGVAMIAKGMEEFINGDVVDAAADVESGAKAVAASVPAAKIDVKIIAANPVPVIEAVVPVVAAEVQKASSS